MLMSLKKQNRKKIELPNIEIPSTSKVGHTKILSKENLNVQVNPKQKYQTICFHPKQNQI